MLRNTRTILLLFAASAFDSSPGTLSDGTPVYPEPQPQQPETDPNAQNFNPEVNPPLSGFNTSTSTGKNEKSYEESISQQAEPNPANQEGQPTGEQFREDNPEVPLTPSQD